MQSDKIKVLYAASEASPFCKTGGLGDVAGSFPRALVCEGIDARVIMPLYSSIDGRYRERMEKVTDFTVPLSWRNEYCGVYKLVYNGVIFYFLDNEYYFKRDGLYGFFDDGERMAFYSKALLEALLHIDFRPQILHANDWHAALSIVYLREMYNDLPDFKYMKAIMTIHNIKFQGMYNVFVLNDITGLSTHPDAKRQLMQGDSVNFMRGACNYADMITTVSPTYAKEIQTDFYGEKLQDVFIRRSDIVKGYLNGIDYELYNPFKDKDIYVNYNASNIYKEIIDVEEKVEVVGSTIQDDRYKGEKVYRTVTKKEMIPCDKKVENKVRLQKELGLKVDKDIPLIGIVSRLTSQKGIDLITRILDEVIGLDAECVVLGVGDYEYENAFRVFHDRYNDRVAACIYFDIKLSKKIYASSDLILVPSLFEPCGLSQMIAMRYGALPIVRETGGLKDSVDAYNKYEKTGNGFRFLNYNAHELLYTIKEAIDLYRNDKDTYKKLVLNAMNTDLSWNNTAIQYKKLYEKLLGE